jgi:hypothetical protein
MECGRSNGIVIGTFAADRFREADILGDLGNSQIKYKAVIMNIRSFWDA